MSRFAHRLVTVSKSFLDAGSASEPPGSANEPSSASEPQSKPQLRVRHVALNTRTNRFNDTISMIDRKIFDIESFIVRHQSTFNQVVKLDLYNSPTGIIDLRRNDDRSVPRI